MHQNNPMKIFRLIFLNFFLLGSASIHAAETHLVENGQARSEIVIAEQPQRTVRLAAHELQTYLEKISGAKLPIVTAPTSGVPVQIYVGRSTYTDSLKIPVDGLEAGAYRMVSGENWLALIGDDTDFTPIEPWAKHNGEIVNGKAQAEWDKITGALWGLPGILMYKNRFTLPGEVGRPTVQATEKAAPWQLWGYDERGSFNAVNRFLDRLGVRWYLPGELGEVIPEIRTIPLPTLDETIRPDFSLRRFNFRFATVGHDSAMWAMRLGMRDPYGIQDAHGMDNMTRREEVFTAHPEWFALYGGKRRFDIKANNQLCYSNEELFNETVRYVRAQFDHFKLDVVSVMPPDGYTAMCQCPKCEGKDTPERDNGGLLSDYVWDFVNRVAKEVGKTHPDGKVLNCAYGTYSLPPLKIAKLEPNVLVSIVGGRTPRNNKPEQQAEYRKLRESWLAKTDNALINFENYPFTDRGWYLPAFTPHAMGESINAVKGKFLGEDIWLTVRPDFDKVGLGFNHFLVYFNARLYWGGKEADADGLLREYCRLFYGPAEREMLAFFEYSEANWQEMEKDKSKADRALELFAAARTKADPKSVYGQRLALIDDFLKGLRNKSEQLSKIRGPLPVLRLVGEARDKIVIDGKLDEDAWVNAFPSATCHLRELQTGRQPTFGTTVKSTWLGNNLYFAIRCDEEPGGKPNIGTTKKDDAALWYGDAVEVLIETESRSYYQIAISPSGAVADLDRSAAKSAWFSWDSQAEVATHLADDHWIIEMRVPVIQDENDPLHQVIGHKPNKSLPWHVNLCRQRIREDGSEYSAFSPTGTDGFHEVMKFATFYDGNSFEFNHGPPDPDFLEAIRLATDLARTGKREEALAAYTAAADRGITDLQKSHALELAASSARHLRKLDLADQITAHIPVEAVKKAVQMQSLLDQGKAGVLIEQFAKEDISAWPFWKRGDGFFARGRAFSITKAGREADADLTSALAWISEARLRDSVLLSLGQNSETNLQDDEGALKRYHEIIGHQSFLGSSDQFYAVHGISRIQTKRNQFDEALATLRQVDPEKLQGFWRSQFQLWQGDALKAAGRNEEAQAAYQALISDETADPRLRKLAEEKITRK